MEVKSVVTITLVCKGCGIVFEKEYKSYIKAKMYKWTKDDGFYHAHSCFLNHNVLHNVHWKEVTKKST